MNVIKSVLGVLLIAVGVGGALHSTTSAAMCSDNLTGQSSQPDSVPGRITFEAGSGSKKLIGNAVWIAYKENDGTGFVGVATLRPGIKPLYRVSKRTEIKTSDNSVSVFDLDVVLIGLLQEGPYASGYWNIAPIDPTEILEPAFFRITLQRGSNRVVSMSGQIAQGTSSQIAIDADFTKY